ncbi:MAG: DUF3810 family protein [Acidobacteriota bacterium]|nr:DUF3810 family protein [Acidobacteriota bacterium]
MGGRAAGGWTAGGVAWRAALLVLAAAAGLARWPRAWVERDYSEGVYLALQARLTPLSNLVPWSLFDPLIGLAIAVIAAAWWRGLRSAPRGRRLARAARLVTTTAACGAGAYLLFLACWGLNYQRTPLADKLQFDPAAVSRDAQRALAIEAVAAVNRLYPSRAAATGWPRFDRVPGGLAQAFAEVQRELGARRLAVPGVPKRTLLQPYFSRAGVDGMVDPFFLEALIDRRVLPFERPFVLAHEWAHLAGYADESEANFIGWLTCLRSHPADQYSGWLFLFEEAMAGLPSADQRQIAARLDEGPRRDLAAERARLLADLSPWLQQAGWRVYDRYLKANRVTAGVASYREVVRLVLGTRFAPGGAWRPLLK